MKCCWNMLWWCVLFALSCIWMFKGFASHPQIRCAINLTWSYLHSLATSIQHHSDFSANYSQNSIQSWEFASDLFPDDEQPSMVQAKTQEHNRRRSPKNSAHNFCSQRSQPPWSVIMERATVTKQAGTTSTRMSSYDADHIRPLSSANQFSSRQRTLATSKKGNVQRASKKSRTLSSDGSTCAPDTTIVSHQKKDGRNHTQTSFATTIK